jgi:hypothetical protein
VVAVQRASSDLKLKPHLHVVFLDGVYVPSADSSPEFRPLPHLIPSGTTLKRTMASGFLDATLRVSGRPGPWSAALGLLLSALGCSSSAVDVSRTATPGGDGAPDSGPPRPPRWLCTGSDGGAGAPTDAIDPSCTWERCPGAVALSLGTQNCVRMGDATVRCTSDTGSELVDQGLSGVQMLASGSLHHCALRSDETVWCWGDNKWGALGDPSLPKETSRAQPAMVPGLANVVRVRTRDSFNQMDTTCALVRSGEVICWGGDWPRAPTRVAGLAGSREIAVADASICGLRDTATVRCVYPDGTLTTYLLDDRIVDLIAAFYMLCARTESFDVFCMGAGENPAPSLVPELGGARLLAAGLAQACALLADGTIACGQGSEGSTFSDRCEGTDVVDLQATQRSLCALHADGTIRCGASH